MMWAARQGGIAILVADTLDQTLCIANNDAIQASQFRSHLQAPQDGRGLGQL